MLRYVALKYCGRLDGTLHSYTWITRSTLRVKSTTHCPHWPWLTRTAPSVTKHFKGATSSFVYFEKISLNFSKSSFPICFNLLHPQPSSFFLVQFRITPLVFFVLGKLLFLGFPTLEPWFRPSMKWFKISWRSSFKHLHPPRPKQVKTYLKLGWMFRFVHTRRNKHGSTIQLGSVHGEGRLNRGLIWKNKT